MQQRERDAERLSDRDVAAGERELLQMTHAVGGRNVRTDREDLPTPDVAVAPEPGPVEDDTEGRGPDPPVFGEQRGEVRVVVLNRYQRQARRLGAFRCPPAGEES